MLHLTGDYSIEKRDFDKALTIFRKINSIRKDDVDTLTTLGIIEEELGNMSAAGSHFENALSIDKNNIRLLKRLLAYYNKTEQPDRAAQILEQLMALSPDDDDFRWEMVQYLEERELYGKAADFLSALLKNEPENLDYLLAHGRILSRQGLEKKAISSLDKVIANNPDSASAHYELGCIYMRMNDEDRARQEFNSAVRLGLESAEIFADLALLYLKQDDEHAAIEMYEKASEQEPENIEYVTALADIYFKMNQPEEALKRYKVILENSNDNLELLLKLNSLYQTQDMFEESIELLKKSEDNYQDIRIQTSLARAYSAINKFDMASEALDKASSIEPDNISLLVERADLLMNRGKPDEALSSLKEFCSDHPNESILTLALAKAFERNSQLDQAIVKLKGLIKFDTDNADAHAELGRMHISMGRNYDDESLFGEGVKSLRRAIELDPKQAMAYFYLGEVYHAEGDIDNAVRNVSKAFELDPTNVAYKRRLDAVQSESKESTISDMLVSAATHCDRDMIQNAIQEYENVLELDEDNVDALHHLGSIYRDKDEIDRAKDYLKHALKVDEDHKSALLLMGKMLFEESEFDEASTFLEHLTDIEPEFFAGHYYYGLVLGSLNREREGISELERAAAIQPEEPETYYQIGLLHQKIGQLEDTKKFFNQTFKLDPTRHEITEFFQNEKDMETQGAVGELRSAAEDRLREGDLQVARQRLEEIVVLEPSNLFAAYWLGHISEINGSIEEAIFQFEKSRDQDPDYKEFQDIPVRLGRLYAKKWDSEQAVARLKEAVAMEPNRYDINQLLLAHYQNAFNIDEMEEVDGQTYADVLAYYTDQTKSGTYLSWFNLGMVYFLRLDQNLSDDENITKAATHFEKAASIDNKNVLPLLQLTLCYKHLNQTNKVISTCKKLISIEPDNILGHDRLAEAYVRTGELEAAIGEIKQIIELDPSNCLYRMKLIDLYKMNYEKEENAADQFAKLKKDFERRMKEDANNAWAHFDMGYAYLELTSMFSVSEEDMSAATFEFKQLMTMATESPWSYWGLKMVYNKESSAGKPMYDQAILACKQAVEKNPYSAQGYYELGQAYNGNYVKPMKSEALNEYKKAVELDPFMLEAHFKIASIYRILNQHEEAIKTYRRVIALDPTSAAAKDARRSLVHIEKSRNELL
jgi:tetratricopeptide (TPR) repeat protein